MGATDCYSSNNRNYAWGLADQCLILSMRLMHMNCLLLGLIKICLLGLSLCIEH